MNPILRNILAVIAGIVIGSIINSGLVNLGPSIIPPPEGADLTTIDGIKASMELFEFKNFIFPFLAHALGTLAGAFTVAKLAANNNMKFAMGIGAFYLLGGISVIMMVGGPLWFNILDLVVAYIPMGYLGGKLAAR
ncbi:MAG: hypothetical protein HKO89_04100 [Saprospiraceae bacterium]|nr:hypothetical protein [Saprospiraceae bacterium]